MKKSPPPLSATAENFPIGTYRHYKGDLYMALAIGRNEATMEEVVIYQALYDEEYIWVRPLTVFLEKIEMDGEKINRFEFVDE